MISLQNNDDVLQFGRDYNLGNDYNDILFRYLVDYFDIRITLPDLLARYRREVGVELIPPIPGEGSYYVESYYVEDYYVG